MLSSATCVKQTTIFRRGRLCEYSFELLMNFLQGARLWLLSGVVNARLKFDTYPGKPVALDAEGALEDDAGVLTAQVTPCIAFVSYCK